MNRRERRAKEREMRKIRKKLQGDSKRVIDSLPPASGREVCDLAGNDIGMFLAIHAAGNPGAIEAVRRVRTQKAQGARPVPSARLFTSVDPPPAELQRALVDRIAHVVDENVVGRSQMCEQFAILLGRALELLGVNEVRVASGTASYPDRPDWSWDHFWVLIASDVVVDGNADSMRENPMVPDGIDPDPVWCRRGDLTDRILRPKRLIRPGDDADEDIEMWWGELKPLVEGLAAIGEDK